MFTGITLAVGASIITIAGSAGPRLAIALGLWAMGAGWVMVGWQYPQPLWSTVPLAIAITLIAPGIAVWQHGWVYAIGIGTAGAAIVAAVSRRRTALLATGTLTLFSYVTSAVVRYFHASLGLPATLAACGVLLLAFAVVMARIRRSEQRHTAERQTAELHTAERLAEEQTAKEPDLRESEPSAGPELSDEPILHLPKAS
jgi:beta-lactamase regulating signal transducer with metallopeptidase domain